jgi:hypothetical protein
MKSHLLPDLSLNVKQRSNKGKKLIFHGNKQEEQRKALWQEVEAKKKLRKNRFFALN